MLLFSAAFSYWVTVECTSFKLKSFCNNYTLAYFHDDDVKTRKCTCVGGRTRLGRCVHLLGGCWPRIQPDRQADRQR